MWTTWRLATYLLSATNSPLTYVCTIPKLTSKTKHCVRYANNICLHEHRFDTRVSVARPRILSSLRTIEFLVQLVLHCTVRENCVTVQQHLTQGRARDTVRPYVTLAETWCNVSDMHIILLHFVELLLQKHMGPQIVEYTIRRVCHRCYHNREPISNYIRLHYTIVVTVQYGLNGVRIQLMRYWLSSTIGACGGDRNALTILTRLIMQSIWHYSVAKYLWLTFCIPVH